MPQSNTAANLNEEQSSVVVDFPYKFRNAPSGLDNKSRTFRMVPIPAKRKEAIDLAEDLMEEMMFRLFRKKMEFEDEIYEKDCILVLESITSLIMKHMDEEHPMQKVAEEIIELDEDPPPMAA